MQLCDSLAGSDATCVQHNGKVPNIKYACACGHCIVNIMSDAHKRMFTELYVHIIYKHFHAWQATHMHHGCCCWP